MFESIRKHSKWLMLVLFLLVIPSFVLVGIDSSYFSGGSPVVARVDGADITRDEWDNAHRIESDRLRAQQPGLDAKLLDSPAAHYATLERMVRDRVLQVAKTLLGLLNGPELGFGRAFRFRRFVFSGLFFAARRRFGADRMADDLDLSKEQVTENLMFTDAKFGETMQAAMTEAEGEKWFGKAPPDLSLVARNKAGGPDWTYTFLKSFYADPTRPSGWNNTLLVGASMPHVLWELQGVQHPVQDAAGHVERLELADPGSQSPVEYDHTVRDIANFLNYVGEPSAAKRRSLGVWVILFLAGFSFLAWLLKQEYWRDVH